MISDHQDMYGLQFRHVSGVRTIARSTRRPAVARNHPPAELPARPSPSSRTLHLASIQHCHCRSLRTPCLLRHPGDIFESRRACRFARTLRVVPSCSSWESKYGFEGGHWAWLPRRRSALPAYSLLSVRSRSHSSLPSIRLPSLFHLRTLALTPTDEDRYPRGADQREEQTHFARGVCSVLVLVLPQPPWLPVSLTF
ncbi:hypothetical protein MVEN_01607500 [Mycena venus]|uniref:Uncharacterized protein n=1 Tax=Mycena venus TaxID=2733690 RepID=A0A8H6XRI7_9AGAR|nr:hypothetical protein MVEN_01607500 [Mycena venus]